MARRATGNVTAYVVSMNVYGRKETLWPLCVQQKYSVWTQVEVCGSAVG